MGDSVTLAGTVTKLSGDDNFVNCAVQLEIQMPPAGTVVTIEVNTAQLQDNMAQPQKTSEETGASHHTPTRAARTAEPK